MCFQKVCERFSHAAACLWLFAEQGPSMEPWLPLSIFTGSGGEGGRKGRGSLIRAPPIYAFRLGVASFEGFQHCSRRGESGVGVPSPSFLFGGRGRSTFLGFVWVCPERLSFGAITHQTQTSIFLMRVKKLSLSGPLALFGSLRPINPRPG